MQIRTASEFAYADRLRFLNQFIEGHNGFIAGGVFRSIFLGQPINDIDIWFCTKHDYEAAYMLYSNAYPLIVASDYAKTFMVNGYKVQLIHRRFYNTVSDLFDDFDFTVSMFALLSGSVFFHEQYFEDLFLRKLQLANEHIKNPYNVMKRLVKYAGYGFKMGNADFFHLVEVLRMCPSNTYVMYSDSKEE
jgi:hypothetical protein